MVETAPPLLEAEAAAEADNLTVPLRYFLIKRLSLSTHKSSSMWFATELVGTDVCAGGLPISTAVAR